MELCREVEDLDKKGFWIEKGNIAEIAGKSASRGMLQL
jgi:hypothetical protein